MLYRRPNLSETCLWILGTILEIDHAMNQNIVKYLQQAPNLYVALKTTFDGFQNKSLHLKWELIKILNYLDQFILLANIHQYELKISKELVVDNPKQIENEKMEIEQKDG